MIRLKLIIFGCLLSWITGNLNAQFRKYEPVTVKHDTLISHIRIYSGLIHQHQNFFHKAFSFQGIEAGVILNHTILAGVYGSLFISNLDAHVADYSGLFVNIKQGGLFIGSMTKNVCKLHYGWLLNAGYFSLTGKENDFALFQDRQSIVSAYGLVLSPQVFAEMNVTRWLKVRTGLSYSIYNFEDQSIIKKHDLNNVSLSFGFVFGKFN